MNKQPGCFLAARINLPTAAAKSIMNISTSRALAFMGLAINRTADPRPDDFVLHETRHMRPFPEDSPAHVYSAAKEEFDLWIILNGFRELLEAFSQYLDKIYECVLWVVESRRTTQPLDFEQMLQNNVAELKRFGHKGIREKCHDINVQVDCISDENISYLKSIQTARNCLSHSRGIIRERDCSDEKVFELRWLGVDGIHIDERGNEARFALPIEQSMQLAAGEVGLQLVTRRETFEVGQRIQLSSKNLAEICYYFSILSDELEKKIIDFALRESGDA